MNQIDNSFNTFINTYEPEYNQIILNKIDSDKYNIKDIAPFDGYMYEPFNKEFEYIRNQSKDKVWTIIDDGDDLYLISGFHIINSVGYIVTKMPYKTKNEIYKL